jgi:hypothetical protein
VVVALAIVTAAIWVSKARKSELMVESGPAQPAREASPVG